MMRHSEVFNRLAEESNFAALWAIEDACSREVDEAYDEMIAATARVKLATSTHEKNWARVDEYYARAKYAAKYAAYVDFMKG